MDIHFTREEVDLVRAAMQSMKFHLIKSAKKDTLNFNYKKALVTTEYILEKLK